MAQAGLIVTDTSGGLVAFGNVVVETTGGPGPPGNDGVGLNWIDAGWDAFTTFNRNDAVSHNGSSYRAVATNINSEPPSADWLPVAEKGEPGDAGGGPGPAGPGYVATSTSSLSIGTGSKSFTTQEGLAYTAGARARASSAANVANWMEGIVTSYSSTTLVVLVDLVGGSGTHADWNINIAGTPGSSGVGGSGYLYDVTREEYGAVGDGVTNDAPAIQLAVDAAATAGGRQTVFLPDGTYLVHDPDTDPHDSSSDGPIRIPIGASIAIRGSHGAKLLLGPNGCGVGLIRIFGRDCEVSGIEIDLNGTVPLKTKANVAIEINGAGGGVSDVDGCDNVVEKCYIHGSRFLTEYSTGTISYDHAGHGLGDRALILTGGTWPAESDIIDSDDPDSLNLAVVLIAGTWYDVTARLSDTVLQLSASDNPGSDVASGTAYTLNAEPYKHQGRDGIQVLNGNRNRIDRNYLEDVGWSAIRMAGNCNVASFNILKEFRGNGIRLLDGDNIVCEGNFITSDKCSGRVGIIADAGSGEESSISAALTNNDIRTQRLVLRNNVVRCNSNGNFEGAGAALKLAAVRDCIVDGGEYYAGTATNNVAIRVEDCIRKVQFVNGVRIIGMFYQTNGIFAGALSSVVSSATANYTGKAQFNLVGHGLVRGKSIYVTNCPITAWNDQEFIVLEVVDANNVVVGRITDADGTVTPEDYTASSITDTQVHGSTHEMVFRDCFFERSRHDEAYFMRFITSPYLDIEGCIFEQVQAKAALVKEGGLLLDYPSDLAIQRLRFVNNEFKFSTDKLCRAIRCVGDNTDSSAANVLLTSGKIICYGNKLRNKNTGTVSLVNVYETNDSTASYDDRLIIFSTDGETPTRFRTAALPTESVVTWSQGDALVNTGPTSGGVPGWVCTTGGKASPVFRAQSPLQYTTFFSTANGTAVANFDANEEVSATPTTGVGSLQFGGNRALTVGEWFDLTASGSYSTTVTPTLNFGVSLGMSQIGNGASGSPVGTAAETGRTSLADATAFTTGSSVSNLRWRLELKGVVKVVATSGTVQVTGRIAYETATDTWVEKWIEPADVTVNTSATNHNRKLDVWAAWGTKSASNTFTCKQFSSVTR